MGNSGNRRKKKYVYTLLCPRMGGKFIVKEYGHLGGSVTLTADS